MTFTSTFVANLKSHMRINHDPEKLKRCPDCDFETSSRKAAAEHSRMHHAPAGTKLKYQCPDCSYQCMAVTAMNTHRMVCTCSSNPQLIPAKCQHAKSEICKASRIEMKRLMFGVIVFVVNRTVIICFYSVYFCK
jgi:ssDNA-binding Zn-finger/Zn-ribbon topoisomerase 1